MNNIILIGNLCRDPEVTTTPNGIAVCKFSIAVNRNFTNAQGEKEVDFFNIVAWRALGENCGKYLSKGNKVAIRGRVEIRNFEDKDRNKRQAIDVVAEDIQFLTPKSSDSQTNAPCCSKPTSQLTPVEDDGLPF